ncbi:translation initiation factor IF-2 [Amyelois transitella]|uniref:translation initiation factor IF-2 n=1 Tax=Amyelois transitella TaxID=680683 RepID=UPI0029907676|nr:translation initiation factor IF-2 [Amyelois transitella]
MSSNLENDRSVTTGKMYPIDLAPQKITIVKNVSSEVKMAHVIPCQPKTTSSGQIITHAGPVGLMRPAAQILAPNVASQPQMIVSGSPILQGTQIMSQGQSTQIMSQSQLITPSGQLISPGTQIISQGTQLSAPLNNTSNTQTSVAATVSGTQVVNMGAQLVSGPANLVMSPSVRTLPPVRVLPPLPHHNTRPVISNMTVSSAGNVFVGKSVAVTSHTPHVPRGLAAGASLAIRQVLPGVGSQPVNSGTAWSSNNRGPRNALVYGARGPLPRAAPRPVTPAPAFPTTPISTPAQHSAIVTLATTSVLTTGGVISGAIRSVAPRATTLTPTTTTAGPRALPLLQRNYPPKVLGVGSVRGVVGNSAPAQLYYEVPRPAPTPPSPRPAAPHQVSVVNTVQSQPLPESRPPATVTPVLPRPSILRKRDVDDSPTKTGGVGPPVYGRADGTGWEDVPTGSARGSGGSGGSTTISASSSPAPDDEPDPPQLDGGVSPRKKPRKQMLTNEVRQCEFPQEEAPPTPPPIVPPKRPQLKSSYVCSWRATALHFTRPSDVRKKEPRAKDIIAIASQKHVLASADGWKVHHLTAQMEDLISLESDVSRQQGGLLKSLETASGRVLSSLKPHSHTLLELLKSNIQRSKKVCEGIEEARDDLLKVFTHRNFVSDILTRQADKRSFRKHRSQS